ncbi:hypothetical protein GCM10027452_44070 [Micromonospora halotolerans]
MSPADNVPAAIATRAGGRSGPPPAARQILATYSSEQQLAKIRRTSTPET